jgi:hypothetical protein
MDAIELEDGGEEGEVEGERGYFRHARRVAHPKKGVKKIHQSRCRSSKGEALEPSYVLFLGRFKVVQKRAAWYTVYFRLRGIAQAVYKLNQVDPKCFLVTIQLGLSCFRSTLPA